MLGLVVVFLLVSRTVLGMGMGMGLGMGLVPLMPGFEWREAGTTLELIMVLTV